MKAYEQLPIGTKVRVINDRSPLLVMLAVGHVVTVTEPHPWNTPSDYEDNIEVVGEADVSQTIHVSQVEALS